VRLTRLKFKVRHMMVVVAIAALVLGVQATGRRWAAHRREAAYHGSCERYYSLMADRRFGELIKVPFRSDEDPKLNSLSTKLTRPGEWADGCRSYAAEHHGQKVYWESRW
jgi:hypothetical protein